MDCDTIYLTEHGSLFGSFTHTHIYMYGMSIKVHEGKECGLRFASGHVPEKIWFQHLHAVG
jgi:hypothetical protein